MKVKSRRPLLAAATAVFAVLILAAPVLADLTKISGYAYGESVDVFDGLVTPIHVQSGPLPTAGPFSQSSPFSAGPTSVASVCVGTVAGPIPPCNGDILTTGLLTVETVGTLSPGAVNSTASVLNVSALNLTGTGGLVTGDVVAAQCAVDSTGATSGSSTLTNVQVNGIVVASNPGPNTKLVLVNAGSVIIGTVTLNEQTYDSLTNTLTVNAIHIHLTSTALGLTGDIIISHVECDALPAGPAPVIPESPLAILLPLSALVVGGGILLVVLRRQQTLQAR
jgi:hypothetical protein